MENTYMKKLRRGWKVVRPYLPRAQNRRDLILTICSTIYLLIAMFVMSIAQSYTDIHNPNRQELKGANPHDLVNSTEMNQGSMRVVDSKHGFYLDSQIIIPDVSFRLHDEIPVPHIVPDLLLISSTIFMFAIPLLSRELAFQRSRRIIYTIGTMMLLRSVSISLTILPNPLPTCNWDVEENIIYGAWLIFIGQRVTCGDVFFSGHTISFALSAWVWITYVWWTFGPRGDRQEIRFENGRGMKPLPAPIPLFFNRIPYVSGLLVCLVCLNSFFGALSMLASLFHYSIDILFSFILVTIFWNLWHCALYIPDFRSHYTIGKLIFFLDHPFAYKDTCQSENSTDYFGADMVSDIVFHHHHPTDTHISKSETFHRNRSFTKDTTLHPIEIKIENKE